MAGEHADGSAEAESGATLRIASSAIAWSARERMRSLVVRWMAASLAIAVVALGVGLPFDSGFAGGLFGLAMLSAALAPLGLLPPLSRRGVSAGVVERRGDALVIPDGASTSQRIALTEVTQGWIEDVAGEADASDVVLRLRNGRDVRVRVAGRADGEALLRAARVSVADRVLRMPLRSRAASQRFGLAMGIASLAVLVPSLVGGVGGLIWFVTTLLHRGAPIANGRGLTILIALLVALGVFSLAGVAWLARFFRQGEAAVGTDGVALKGFGKSHFIAYSRVRRVARDPRGVRLYLNDGVSQLLATTADAGALFDRIDQAMKARGQSRVASVQLAQLDRGGRSLVAWRTELRALLAVEGAGYRGAALGSDQLADVVEDAGARTERRIAAALALSGHGDVEARQRVRIAVEACADEDLRAALAQAAEGEIEEPKLKRAMARRGTSG